ncbi:MAG: alanine racemase [Leucothrix sp.]
MRPAQAIIDLAAIRHNYGVAKSTAPQARAIAIIKANGYGHGAVEVGKTLSPIADGFGVACIEEGLELRESGITNPILLLEGIFDPDELPLVDEYRFSIAVATHQQLNWLLESNLKQPIDVFLKVDSGMHRLGIAPADTEAFYTKLNASPKVKSVILMTHFSSADEPEKTTTDDQLQRFNKAIEGIDAPSSLANSAGTLVHPTAHQQFVRPGIMLYGATPLGHSHATDALLKPAMSLRSAIFSIRDLAVGEPIGYAGRYICNRPTRVGVVAMGYADGYPRHAVDGTPVSINGHRSRIIGKVSMDMLTVDLTDLPHIKEGAPVELWGNEVRANEVADCCDTISYTLFTGVTRRVPLRYINHSD